MMLEFQNPIPVVVENDLEGYAIYVTNGGSFENDIWCVVHCKGGLVRHYRSDQIKIYINATLSIQKTETPK
jgi:hypothetical protein